jgi:hypothetical protein
MVVVYLDAQTDVQRQVSAWVTLLSRVVWPALATLVPAGITALFKVMQNHSRNRRSDELTNRISQLAKAIAEVPDMAASPGSGVTPRAALTAELNLAVNELTALQTKVRHSYSFRGVSTTATTKLRNGLLLFRPRGTAATTLHVLFYLYGAVFLFCILAVLMASNDAGAEPFFSTKSASAFFSDFLAFIFLVAIFSVPPLLLHHYAIKIHRKQTASLSDPAHPLPGPAAQQAHV